MALARSIEKFETLLWNTGIARRAVFTIVLVAAISACATLPNVDALLDRPASSVRFQTAAGPLSEKKSAALLAALKRKAGDTDILDKHVAVENALVETPLVLGNRVRLLHDGPQTYDAMFSAIASARDHIHLETYIFDEDEIGHQFADALIAKRGQGVQVSVIYDSVGAIKTSRAFFDRLSAVGVEMLEFNPVNPLTARAGWQVNNRDHRKLLVVDGRTAFVGGINISGVYSRGSWPRGGSGGSHANVPWRDMHMQIDGPVVADYQKLFVETWEKQKGPRLAPRTLFPALKDEGREIVRAVGSTPDDPYSQMYLTLLSAIRSAERAIHLTNAYFVPDPNLLEVLRAASARGVDVKLILPSRSDSAVVLHAGRSHYSDLLAAGVKLYERRDALLHAKAAVIDGVWSTVGSTNLDWRSFLLNDELNAVVLGLEFGQQMEAVFARDLAASDPIERETWERRPLSERAKEWGARLLERLL